MPQKTLYKIQKQVAKKRRGNVHALHENSRDVQRLRRASARDDKLARLASTRSKLNQHYLQRVDFFKDAAELATETAIDQQDIQSLIRRYINRDDEELKTLQSQRRPGRPSSTREDQLKQRIDKEKREYISGFWVPDMENPKTMEFLRQWNGQWEGLNVLSFVRISKDGVRHQSSFPPKGES
ncbi:MAG: hypothetical protein M1834_001451 [Cirrosporium novae-zelandiae]|nr:MAG: hypothetical protein M1834_001451 [Cirrosporium novae-zelandiae]